MTAFQIATLVINGLVAVGTISVAIAAIWGDALRSPKLDLQLAQSNPEQTTADDRGAWFYHLEVRNRRGWIPAMNSRVVVSSVSKRENGCDNLRIDLPGLLPLNWQWLFSPEPVRTVGPVPVVCDLGCLIEGKGFRLSLQKEPQNFQGHLSKSGELELTLLPIAHNVRPREFQLTIYWSGNFPSNPSEAQKNLKLRLQPKGKYPRDRALGVLPANPDGDRSGGRPQGRALSNHTVRLP